MIRNRRKNDRDEQQLNKLFSNFSKVSSIVTVAQLFVYRSLQTRQHTQRLVRLNDSYSYQLHRCMTRKRLFHIIVIVENEQ